MPLKKTPGQQKVPVVIAAGDGSGADAFHALRQLLAVDPVPAALAASTPLFRQPDGRPFSLSAVTLAVRLAASKAGETRLQHFSGRSLRVGGASDLQAIGVPSSTIQLMGRWSSDIYRVYTRVCFDELLGTSRRMHGAGGVTLEQRFPGFVQSGR